MLTTPTVREYLVNYARSLIYTTTLSYANVISIDCSFDILESDLGIKVIISWLLFDCSEGNISTAVHISNKHLRPFSHFAHFISEIFTFTSFASACTVDKHFVLEAYLTYNPSLDTAAKATGCPPSRPGFFNSSHHTSHSTEGVGSGPSLPTCGKYSGRR